MYYTYMLRCEDNSIYTGITTDIKRRFEEHLNQDKKVTSKYTKNHKPKKMECYFETENRILASKLEFNIKKLTKLEKEEIIKNGDLNKFLSSKIEVEKYTYKRGI